MKFAAAIGSLLVVITVAGCGGGSKTPTPTFPALQTIRVATAGHEITAELANTPQQRQRGLSNRDALAENAGMLFDLGQVASTQFWMKGMRFPLDMVWIDADKKVAGVTADVPPQPNATTNNLKLYAPPSPIRYVLELNAGAAKKLGFTTGASVDFTLPGVTPAAG